MKTTKLVKGICVLGLFIVATLTSTVHAQEPYVSNDVMTGDQVTSRIIYKKDGGLQHYMKYDFTYDAMNRMATKETLRWDAKSNSWLPSTRIRYRYTDTQIIMEQGRWNELHKAYDADVQQNIYEMNEDNLPVAQLIYTMEVIQESWLLKERIAWGADNSFSFS